MQEKLFRKKALERMASPERLDVLMSITPFRAWLSLLALVGLIAAAIFWGFTGSVPVMVNGEGILLRGGEISAVETSVTGHLISMLVKPGDIVEEGQAIAQIHDPTKNEVITVTSLFRGRILEIRAREGVFVELGTTLVSLEPVNEPLEAIIYVSPFNGKKIEPGMRVQLSPSTVRPEEFGYMLGQVTSVSQFPATNQGMQRVLGSEELVRELSAGGNPIEVHVSLQVDNNAPSGYAWSSPKGPDINIQSGTFTEARIILSEIRPVDRIFASR